jgi:hypothetical protein
MSFLSLGADSLNQSDSLFLLLKGKLRQMDKEAKDDTLAQPALSLYPRRRETVKGGKTYPFKERKKGFVSREYRRQW